MLEKNIMSMKKMLINGSLALLVVTILITSCKKDDEVTSIRPQLIGIWDVTHFGNDINKNGVLESNERSAVDTNSFQAYSILNTDGSSVTYTKIGGISSTLNGKWELINSEKQIKYINLQDTTYLDIKSFIPPEMVTYNNKDDIWNVSKKR